MDAGVVVVSVVGAAQKPDELQYGALPCLANLAAWWPWRVTWLLQPALLTSLEGSTAMKINAPGCKELLTIYST